MPILDPDDPIIAKLKLQLEQLGTALPNPTEAGATFVPAAATAVRETFARDQMAIWATGLQLFDGATMQNVGAPQGDFSFGDDLFNGLVGMIKLDDPALLMLIDIGSTSLDQFIDRAIEYIAEFIADLLENVFDPLINMVGAIPIYGWIIEAVWDVAIGIVKLVKFINEQNAPDPEPEYEAAQFSPDADIAIARKMLRITTEKQDWSDIFRPPGIGKNEGWYSANFFGENLIGGGYRVRTAGVREDWLAYVPGTTTIFPGLETYPTGGIVNRSLGELFPTARNMGTSIWNAVNNKSPSMFAIDAVSCRTLWTGHLQQLREHFYEHDIPGAERFVDGWGMDTFGWSTWDEGKAAFDKMWKDDGYDDWEPYQDDLGVTAKNPNSPAAAMQIIYDRQMAALNTTAVAYVDKSYGAFQGFENDPDAAKIRERLETNQAMLLQHQARCLVDTSSIPDFSYRSAMNDAKENCMPQHLGAIKLPDLVPGNEPPPPPRQIPMGAKLKPLDPGDVKAHVRKGGKLTPFLLLGGAIGLLWAKKSGKI